MQKLLGRLLLRNNPQMLFWLGSLVAISITFLLIRYKIAPTSEPLVLHYNVVVGVDLLGSGTELYRLPLIGLAITVINFTISKLVTSPNNFLSFLAGFVSLFVAVVLFAATLFIIAAN